MLAMLCFIVMTFELGKLKHWVLTILATSRPLVCLEQKMTSTVDATGEPA